VVSFLLFRFTTIAVCAAAASAANSILASSIGFLFLFAPRTGFPAGRGVRVAQMEGTAILNVNEFAQAIRLRSIPGEGISAEGIDRGIDYLDEGTMVVVGNGRRHIGRTIRATIRSTLQTGAGRMLFAEPTAMPCR